MDTKGAERARKYHISGGVKGFAVLDARGGIVYDLLDKDEAERICAVVNRGIGPEWEAVEAELERMEATHHGD